MLHTYWIDIVGTCNLRCPSCATGNFRKSDFQGEEKALGFMAFDMFERILEKIAAERPKERTRIELYNWGEPLLHPRAADFIAKVKSYPLFRCGISSNLSHKVDLLRVVRAQPDWIRVSLSGYFQQTYGRTHRRGDINLVKSNMFMLRHLIDRLKSPIAVEVSYHVYRHNAGEDLERMQALCDELGFKFAPVWASFYPVEKVMAYFDGHVGEADRETISWLAVTPEEFHAAAQPHRADPCRLQEHQTAINHDGAVQLCCATYDPAHVIAPDFLATPAAELAAEKARNATCDACIAGGYHAMMMYRGMDALEPLANARIAERGSKVRLVAGKIVASDIGATPDGSATGGLRSTQ